MAVELAQHDAAYEDLAIKFFENFLGIAWAINNPGGRLLGPGLWDEEDQFYYDKLSTDDGRMMRLKVRSMVGLVPLFAVETLEPGMLDRLKGFERRLDWLRQSRPDLTAQVSRWFEPGQGGRRLLSLLRGDRMKSVSAACSTRRSSCPTTVCGHCPAGTGITRIPRPSGESNLP